jgi:hypothetical protein
MKTSAYAFLIGAMLALPALSQPGGGGIGISAEGFRNTGATRGIEAVPPLEAIPGRWRIEFRIRRYSDNPQATGRWLVVDADMVIGGIYVSGQIRDNDATADFTCLVDDVGRCSGGRIRFRHENFDWDDFAFVVDRNGVRAEGWAIRVDPETGVTREYELRMRKR